jgi:hypothetical protein
MEKNRNYDEPNIKRLLARVLMAKWLLARRLVAK